MVYVYSKDAKGHYVNNAQLWEEFRKWKEELKLYEDSDGTKEEPLIPDYIGESIMKIAIAIMQRPNFKGYTFREEMEADAIINCIEYIKNFDPTKSKSPVSYFSQVCYWAAVRRIKKEKKNIDVKEKLMSRKDIFNRLVNCQETDDTEYALPDGINIAQRNFERSKAGPVAPVRSTWKGPKNRKKIKKQPTLEKFEVEDN